MTTTRNVTTANVGTTVLLPPGLDRDGDSAVVLESCGGSGGYWACHTHRKSFSNNLQASIHEDRGAHLTYWYCTEHGPEQP